MVNDLEILADKYFTESKFLEAENLYKKILINNRKNTLAIYRLAYICFFILNDYNNAELLLESGKSLGVDANYFMLLGAVKEKLFKLYDALVLYEELLKVAPNEDLFKKIGDLYIQLELYDNAINIAQEHIMKYPNIIAYRRLFLMYFKLGKFEELKQIKDEIKEKFSNQGLSFNLLGMYEEFINNNLEEAERLYNKAVKSGVSIAGFDLALCYKKSKKYDEAEKCCKKILKTYPIKNDVCNLLTEINFIQKKMRNGYKYYLSRVLSNDLRKLKSKWDGKPRVDKTILVVSDLSVSECFRNLRYLDSLKSLFKKIIVVTSSEIHSFLSENKINAISKQDLSDVKYDYSVLMSELPYYLNMSFEKIPTRSLKTQKKELPEAYKIGLCFNSNNDNVDSINIADFNFSKYLSSLFDINGVTYYNFDKSISSIVSDKSNVVDISEKIEDISDYAQYLNSMDLVISTDSFGLHLAGCLDVKTFAILPYDTMWYWFEDFDTTPWYSSVHLFRANKKNDWVEVSNRIIQKVKDGKFKEVK